MRHGQPVSLQCTSFQVLQVTLRDKFPISLDGRVLMATATTIGRRRVIGLAVVSVSTWPLAVRAQRARMPVIGFLGYGSARRDDGTLQLIDEKRKYRAGATRGADASPCSYPRGRTIASFFTKSMIAARLSILTCSHRTSPHSTRPAPTWS